MTKPQERPQHVDAFLEEVRQLKKDAFAQSNNDLQQHFKRLRQLQESMSDRVIKAPDEDGTEAA